jgi:hypothetical protein
LKDISHHLLSARTEGRKIFGFHFDAYNAARLPSGGKSALMGESKTIVMGEWQLVIQRSIVTGIPSTGYGLVIQQSADKFLLVGEGYQVTIQSTDSETTFSGILSFNEKKVVDRESGEMKDLRILNGDETRSGISLVMPSEDPDYGDFICSVFVPGETKIAECEVYALRG